MAKLKDREEMFCQEYLIDLNPYQAAIRAKYAPKTAKEAYRWLKEGDSREKPRLRARVEALLAERSRRTEVTQDRVVQELARIAFVDLTQVVDPDTGCVRKDASEDDRAAIASVRVKAGGMFTEYEAKLESKNRALELLGKHLGMFRENMSLTMRAPTIVDIDGDEDG